MKLPKMPKLFSDKPKKRLNAATMARRAAPAMEDYDEEPQTKLSSAFVVVLILHIVAVGGIYAFNSIKANRKAGEPVVANVPSKPIIKSSASTAPTNVGSTGAAKVEPPASAPSQSSAATSAASVAPAQVAPISGARIHHVKTGDTLGKIAVQYGVTVAEIEEANGAKNVATLHQGQVLNIPKVHSPIPPVRKVEDAPKVAAAATPKSGAKTYVVAKGDNPVAIARRLGVSYDELLKLNSIEDPKKLQIGQTLKVPVKKN